MHTHWEPLILLPPPTPPSDREGEKERFFTLEDVGVVKQPSAGRRVNDDAELASPFHYSIA